MKNRFHSSDALDQFGNGKSMFLASTWSWSNAKPSVLWFTLNKSGHSFRVRTDTNLKNKSLPLHYRIGPKYTCKSFWIYFQLTEKLQVDSTCVNIEQVRILRITNRVFTYMQLLSELQVLSCVKDREKKRWWRAKR